MTRWGMVYPSPVSNGEIEAVSKQVVRKRGKYHQKTDSGAIRGDD